jgi:hypothetical protein
MEKLNEAVMDIICRLWDDYEEEFLEVITNAGWHCCEDCDKNVEPEGWCL